MVWNIKSIDVLIVVWNIKESNINLHAYAFYYLNCPSNRVKGFQNEGRIRDTLSVSTCGRTLS